MSTNSKSDALWHLADALSEDILNTRAEDLFAEVAADHENRRALATEFDRISRRGLRRVRRQKYTERLKQLINLPVPTPRFAIASIAALAVIVIASALRDRPFRSAEKQPTNLAGPAAGVTEPIVVARAPKVAPQGLPLPAPAASKITRPPELASLSTLPDKDKRAITIRVNDIRGIAGFILPNDRVDVVLNRSVSDTSRSVSDTIRSVSDTAEGGRRDYSDLLLQDVKVIAVDQIASQQKDNPVVGNAVTLEVTPVQAQKISLATNVGSLSLILRKAGDAAVVPQSRVTEIDLSDEPRPAPPPPAPTSVRIETPPPPPPSDATVTIIRNLKGVDYKVMRESHGRAN
jgi:Flp pilus assembly protein CpaB